MRESIALKREKKTCFATAPLSFLMNGITTLSASFLIPVKTCIDNLYARYYNLFYNLVRLNIYYSVKLYGSCRDAANKKNQGHI
jgi:hypothetical protein